MSYVKDLVDVIIELDEEEKNRPYEMYKTHLQGLVNFGSMTKYMMDKYLREFIKREHDEALIENEMLDNMMKEIFEIVNKNPKNSIAKLLAYEYIVNIVMRFHK